MRGGRSVRGSARAFVFGVLGPGHRCGEVAALLVDELFVSSIRHSGSRAPGETVTVAVKTANDVIRVEVTDLSGPRVPKPRPAGSDAEDGRGAPARCPPCRAMGVASARRADGDVVRDCRPNESAPCPGMCLPGTPQRVVGIAGPSGQPGGKRPAGPVK